MTAPRPFEAAEWAATRELLRDPAVWVEPPAGLAEQVRVAVAALVAGRRAAAEVDHLGG